jgi:peptide/nickel transport system ATP-binding protein
MDQVTARAAAPASAVNAPWLLEVEDLHVHFVTTRGVVRAVEGISYKVKPGEVVALVGESGCGKSVSALAIMRLLARPAGRIVNGRILFQGRNLFELGEDEMREIRGRDIAMIFQEPMTSLNAVLTVGFQIMEPLLIHLAMTPEAARARAVELLQQVGIPDPEQRLDQYPHQFSGGMRQRVMIAIGLACNPRLLIADEPTTALDVTVQAQILEVLDRLRAARGMAVLLITHDLGIVAGRADRVAVMYAGRLVEEASTTELFARPSHPYTRGLLASVPRITGPVARLTPIAGTVPPPTAWPAGCRFHPRCPQVMPRCAVDDPPPRPVAGGHRMRCWLAETGGPS